MLFLHYYSHLLAPNGALSLARLYVVSNLNSHVKLPEASSLAQVADSEQYFNGVNMRVH